MYWSTKASGDVGGELLPALSGTGNTVLRHGNGSRYSGGFLGSGAPGAAAVASCQQYRSPAGRLQRRSWRFQPGNRLLVLAIAISSSFCPQAQARHRHIGDMQQGLMMYSAPKTSGCFMPMRVAP